nr:transcription elongation factor, mitochondrial-like [Nomia melanderi]
MLKSMSNTLCSVKIQKHLRFPLSQIYSDSLEQKILRDNNYKNLENEKCTAENGNQEKYFEEAHIKIITPHCNKNEPLEVRNPSTTVKNRVNEKYNITPKVKWTESPKTVLAFHIGVNIVSWAYVNSTFEVLEWKWEDWCDEKTVTTTTYELINTISHIITMLPTADTYVIEDSTVSARSKHIKKMIIQQHLAVSIMSCIQLKNVTENIYILHPKTTARWFKMIVGSEAISTEPIVTSLLENEEGYNGISVSISEKIKNDYMEMNKPEREQINWSLLKAITFLSITGERARSKVSGK